MWLFKIRFYWTWLLDLSGIVSLKTAREMVRQWHPTERCYTCGWPTRPRDCGTTRQWECPWGCCGYSRYESIEVH